MADNNVVGIKFGVEGGIDGESAHRIKTQLEEIASRINLKVKASIDGSAIEVELKKLKEAAESSLSGGDNKLAAKYTQVEKALEKMYATQRKVNNSQEGSFDWTKANHQLEEQRANYEKLFEDLQKLKGVDESRVEAIKEYKEALELSVNNPPKVFATDIDAAKLKDKAESLFTTNGFDKIIARSKEAQVAVQNFYDKVQTATTQTDDDGNIIPLTKEQVKELNAEFLETQANIKRIGRETDTVGNKIKEAFNEHVIQNIATVLLAVAVRALKQVYDNVVKLDAALTNLQIATGYTRAETAELLKTYASLAKELGATMLEVADAADTWLRQGYSVAETNELIANSMMLAKLGQLSSAEAAKALTSAMKGYKVSVEDSSKVVDKFTAVDMQAAVSAGDIATAMAETAAGADIAGVSMDKLIGYIATVAEVTQDGAESVGTFYKTLFARMGNVKAGKLVDDETGDSLNDVESVLGSLGVSLRDNKNQFRDFSTVLDEVAQNWDNYDNVQQHALATAFAGTRQQEKFIVLMENYGDALNYATTAANSAGTAQSKYNEAYLDSIEAKLNALTASWEELSQSLLDSDIVKFLIDVARGLADLLNSFVGLGDGAPAKFVVIMTSLSLLMSKLMTLFDTLRVRMHLLKMEIASGNLTFVSFFKSIGAAMTEFMAKNAPILIISTIITLMSSLEGKAQGFAELIVGAVTLIATGIIIAIKGVDATIKGFMATNPVGWILLAITAVVAVVKGVIDLIKSFNPSYEDLKEAAKDCIDTWKEAEEELENVRSKIEEVEEQIASLNAIEKPTLTDQKDLERLQQELEILKQEEAVKEEASAKAQRDAMNAAENALDKYRKEKTVTDGDGNVIETFDARMHRILTNYYGSSSSDKELARDALNQYSELLSEFEYGTNEKLNSYLDDYYELLDMYTAATEGATATWTAVLARVKNQGAVKTLKEFANTFSDTSKITGESLQALAKEHQDIKDLFDYLKNIGMWNGDNWDDLTGLVGELRTKLAELAAIKITDDIDSMSESFDALSDALTDVAEKGILSLETLKVLMEEYPDLLTKYFSKSLDGYKLAEDYSDKSDYEIMQDMAISSLKNYQEVLEDAKKTLSGLTKEDDDYETALKNVAIAQDNLNTKEIEWASLLRESAISSETERLQKLSDGLENQLDSYKEIVDVRKELLKTYESEISYQKQLAQKQKSVADLQTQLALAKMDSSASGQAKVREIQAKLQEAQEDLDDYTLERAIEDITTSLDDEYSEYEKFIQEQIGEIENQITGIATTLENILSGVSGLTNTNFTGSEMYDLYTKIKEQQSSGMTVEGGTKSFVDNVSSGNFQEADKYYTKAKEVSDNYTAPTSKPTEKTEDEKIAEEMVKIKGAWGRGIAANKEGDNGIVTWNDKEYHVESAGNDNSLAKAAYEVNGFGDRDIFYYKGDLYGCLGNDGKNSSIVKLRNADGWHNFWNGVGDGNNYSALLNTFKATMGIYHTGGFVGDISTLKSNEEFAKLLKGEFVSTPQQIDVFMRKTLPSIANRTNGAIIEYNSPLIEIKCDNVTEESLPKLNDIVNKAVEKIKKDMTGALSRTGYRKQY